MAVLPVICFLARSYHPGTKENPLFQSRAAPANRAVTVPLSHAWVTPYAFQTNTKVRSHGWTRIFADTEDPRSSAAKNK